MIRWEMIWSNKKWYDQIRNHMIRYELIWSDEKWYDQMRNDMIRWEMIWSNKKWYDQLKNSWRVLSIHEGNPERIYCHHWKLNYSGSIHFLCPFILFYSKSIIGATAFLHSCWNIDQSEMISHKWYDELMSQSWCD